MSMLRGTFCCLFFCVRLPCAVALYGGRIFVVLSYSLHLINKKVFKKHDFSKGFYRE